MTAVLRPSTPACVCARDGSRARDTVICTKVATFSQRDVVVADTTDYVAHRVWCGRILIGSFDGATAASSPSSPWMQHEWRTVPVRVDEALRIG
ncbi:MAG: hypothetical protein H7287_10560 [Thermoleophilia bacterium]|nr:hypothetical protein [Thermoleophilia bacterium]